MRYLYGDSSPAPVQFNFLATVEELVVCAAQVIQLDAEVRGIEAGAAKTAATRTKGLEALERYHAAVMASLHDTSTRSLDGHTIGYADHLAAQASRYIEDIRTSTVQMNDREIAGVRGETERRRVQIRAALDRFFKVARLPTVETRITMTLPSAKEPKHEFASTSVIAGGLIAAFTHDADVQPDWRVPRRVGDIAPGLELLVGARKSWFKKQIQRESMKLDDLLVSGFNLSDDVADLRLRRRPEQRDALLFKVQRSEGGVFAEVHFPDDPESEMALPSNVEPGDAIQLERLWQLLRAASMPVLEHRERVTSLHLDLEDVLEAGREVEVVERVIRLLGPQVTEIERKSPSPHELSLKVEDDTGQRREIYLRKIELLKRLEPLAVEDRMRFAPLALWREEHLSNVSVIVEG